jgi:glycosyltransferase involved in cell wall biosynthesis
MATGRQFDLEQWDDADSHVDELIALTGDYRVARAAYEEAVKNRVQALGLGDSVVFLGFVTDVASVLSLLDIQLNASYGTEATSLSLLEGMSMGLPAVVSDYGGNPYLIEDGVSGLVFKSRDSLDLAKKIRRLMDDKALLKTIGDNAAD